MSSLRGRLLAILSATILIAWLATALFSYVDARRSVAELLDEGLRDQVAESVASHLLHPVIIAIPVLGVLIWLSVSWGLTPLRLLAAEVGRRDPGSLEPLAAKGVPDEARPLVDALNGLFARVDSSIEKERRFTADAAHELRTPLAAIKTHAQVALAAAGEDERRRSLAKVIDGTDRAARLVEQMLTLARLEPGHAAFAFAPQSLAALAAQGVSEAAPMAARKGIELGMTGPAEGCMVGGDAGLLGILLRNLIDNAVRYTPPGGTVDVAVRREGDAVTLTVADDGPGIPEADRARALDRFYRALGTGESGSGLGLSIVARIAELHGGTLTLEAGPGGRGLAASVALRAV